MVKYCECDLCSNHNVTLNSISKYYVRFWQISSSVWVFFSKLTFDLSKSLSVGYANIISVIHLHLGKGQRLCYALV